MNQRTNARAASLEQCKRMLATPHSRSLFLFDLIPLISLIDSLCFSLPLSPFLSLSATCLSYLPLRLCSHPTSDKCILVFHSFTQSSFPSLAILFVLSILCSSPVEYSPLGLSFLFFCPCSSFPELFLTLYPFVFKEWKRGERWKKGR